MNPPILIFLVSLCTLISQLTLKKGIIIVTGEKSVEGLKLSFLFSALTSPVVIFSLFLQGLSYCLWIFVLSKHKLGVAIGLSAAFVYLLLPLLSWLLYDESLSGMEWIGLCLITCGIILVMYNPV